MIGRVLVFLYAALALSAPLSRVMIGSMPLYFIDVLALFVLLAGFSRIAASMTRNRTISLVVILFIVSLLPTVLAEMARMGFSQPFYLFARTVLHVLSIWSLFGLLRSPAALRWYVTGAAIGVMLTASIAAMHSLPATGPWVRSTVMMNPLLTPRGVATRFETEAYSLDVDAERGNSLIGKSNPTGMVLVSMLPLLLGAFRYAKLGPVRRGLLALAMLLSLFAIVVTYSRATYLSFAIVLFAYLFVERAALAKRLIPLMVLVFLGISFVGTQSGAFKFDFIVAKFDLSNEDYAGTNMARVLSYTRPVQLLFEDPSYFIRGAGRTYRKLREENPDAAILELRDSEMHSVFAASIFYRGFPAMVLLFTLYYLIVSRTYRAMRYARRNRNPAAWFATAALISVVSLIPHMAFDHHLVNGIGNHAHMFVLFALALTSMDYVRRAAGAPARVGSTVASVPKPILA